MDASLGPSNNEIVSTPTRTHHAKIRHSGQRGHRDETPATVAAAVSIRETTEGYGDGPPTMDDDNGTLELLCGPLLNYKCMTKDESGLAFWHGSVLIVTKPKGQARPSMSLNCASASFNLPEFGKTDAVYNETNAQAGAGFLRGTKLYEDTVKTFWRFDVHLPFQGSEATWSYTIPDLQLLSGKESSKLRYNFVVPAHDESMRILFHSCNGFSVGTDEDAWSGPALWNDVLRAHRQRPFHVMIGGGDQIYNDGVRVTGPLKSWTDIGNPKKRRDYPFPRTLRDECDSWYFSSYKRWYSMEPFSEANSSIPQINVWDDHDIIDGFGSYSDHFMQCAVFRGIGGVSLKYYCLFQHHVPPPVSTYTTDAPQTTQSQGLKGSGADPDQLEATFVCKEIQADSSFIIGDRPGPYVEERSRSLYMQLGARIAFVGIDARTERTRHQVNYPDTYEKIFARVAVELTANPALTHLIVLLGVPIAYPRLQWLENLFTSPVIGPIRFLNKRFGLAGGFFNHFDGQVDLLDDLDDHYTAHAHKKERKSLMLRLQRLAQEFNIRVTILGGDVHLAAIGRFYSNPKLQLPVERDPRYMANIISSAITNKPPPKAVANLLARRNFIHHLDRSTDETLMNLFDKDPGTRDLTNTKNKCTMPSRNYAIITETPLSSASDSHLTNINIQRNEGDSIDGKIGAGLNITARFAKDGHSLFYPGEVGAGTKHSAASGVHQGSLSGGLDVAIRVEIEQSDREGKTEGYGFSIPTLNREKPATHAALAYRKSTY